MERAPRVCPPEPQDVDDEGSSLDFPFAVEVDCVFPLASVLPEPENELACKASEYLK